MICLNLQKFGQLPYGLVVRIRRSHRRGPGSIPGVGRTIFLLFSILTIIFLGKIVSKLSGVEAEYFHFKYSLFPAHFSQVFIIPCLF